MRYSTNLTRFITPGQAAKTLGYSRESVLRWILKGCGGVRLQAVKVGGQWRTTDRWVTEFIRKRNEAVEIPNLKERQKEADMVLAMLG